MRLSLAFLLLLLYNLRPAKAIKSKEEDGFHTLLRRSATSVEFDRPLVREERASEEDFENDDEDFVTRNRRSNEDKFYQTLLSRSESKQDEKRSFDTDDVDNKAGFIIREDWTGDSKISDADRQELENLFSTLNPTEEEKKEQVRDVKIEDEPGTVKGAAEDYTKWLMSQKGSNFKKSLNHKIEVDHQLSKMFFKSSLPAVAAQKKPVTRSAPAKKQKLTAKKASTKNAKSRSNIAAATSNLPPLCNDNTKECLCKKACAPRPVASASPCNCGMPPPAPAPAPAPEPAPAPAPPPASIQTKKLSMQRAPFIGSRHSAKPCGKDDAQCLCARACYPRPVTNANPCDCGMPAPPPPSPPPLQFIKASPGTVKSKTPACNKNDAKCLCARACYPRPVANAKPCDCGMPAPPPPPPPPPPAKFLPARKVKAAQAAGCANNDAQCLCAKSCHPRPVASAKPCNCGMPPPAPAPAPAPEPAPEPAPAPAPEAAPAPAEALATGKKAPFNCKPHDGKCLCARACYPRPVAKASPCDCGMPAPPPPPPPPAEAAATNVKLYTPAVSWCAKACKPRHVLSTSPCQCHPDEPAQVAPRQPKPLPKAKDTQETLCARTCHPRPVSSTKPCQCGVPVPGDNSHVYPIAAPIAPEAALKFPAINAFDSIAQTSAVQGPARSSVAKKEDAHKKENKPAPEETEDVYYSRSTGLPVKYLDISAKNYQGCFKDRKPGRDLPRRFTRYAMTPEVCLRECKYQGYNFAGLQYAYLCFCGNAFGRYGKVDDAYCNARCLGDKTRACGAFWHNSVYSIDGHDYDPTDFDFHKVDADELRKDSVAQKEGFDPSQFSSSTKAKVANNLVKAAEAALKAAKKLLPDSKSKIFSKSYNGKHKRDDDEDSELEEMKLSAMASLGAAKKLLKRTPLVDPAKHKDKEKRSIAIGDEERVDLDNGKDLLVAYLGGIADYRRQIRSVDDDDDDDFLSDDSHPKFEYKRMAIGASGDGEFISKYSDDIPENDDKSKRSVKDNDEGANERKVLLPVKITKRSARKSRKAHKRDKTATAGIARAPQDIDALNETVATDPSPTQPLPTDSAPQPPGPPAPNPLEDHTASNESILDAISRHTVNATDETGNSTTSSNATTPVIAPSNETASNITPSNATLSNVAPLNATSSIAAPVNSTADEGSKIQKDEKLQSISVKAEKSFSIRKRRSLEDEDESDGVKKMAARGDRSEMPLIKRNANEDDDDTETEFARLLNEESEAEVSKENRLKRSNRGAEISDIEDDYIPTATQPEAVIEKRSVSKSSEKKDRTVLRDHVEKGVERLMNLVINLYKEQSTIRGFEESVRSLKSDIAKELKASPKQKDEVMKELRNEIQKTAGKKLEDLTTSIRDEIKTYATSHPEVSKIASTAVTTMPDLPISDAQYARSRREIEKRSAELDDNTEEVEFKPDHVPEILKQHFKRNAESEFKGERVLSRNHRNVPEDEMLDEELQEIVES